MADFARLASIIDAADQRLDQTELSIAGFQQDRTATGTRVLSRSNPGPHGAAQI